VAGDVQQAPETGDRQQQLKLFGERIRELRLKAGMRQSDLAEKARLDRIAISNIERGLSLSFNPCRLASCTDVVLALA
jgi:DNA-binding XRE family transcriptional regulator